MFHCHVRFREGVFVETHGEKTTDPQRHPWNWYMYLHQNQKTWGGYFGGGFRHLWSQKHSYSKKPSLSKARLWIAPGFSITLRIIGPWKLAILRTLPLLYRFKHFKPFQKGDEKRGRKNPRNCLIGFYSLFMSVGNHAYGKARVSTFSNSLPPIQMYKNMFFIERPAFNCSGVFWDI